MKRVQIAANGLTVANVSLLSSGSPDGVDTFIDVADAMRVEPNATWNKSYSSPSFLPAPVLPFSNPVLFQCLSMQTDANGQLPVVWPVPFSDIPIPISCQVFDPTGGTYAFTLLENSTNGLKWQVKKARPLPAVIALLGTLSGYDTYQPAPAGITCYVSAKLN